METNLTRENTSTKKLWLIGGAIILVLLILIAVVGQEDNSEITIITPQPQTVLFVDGAQRGLSTTENQEFAFTLDAGEHSVIVAKEGHWPWGKEFEIGSGEDLTFRPFLIPQAENLTVTEADPTDENVETTRMRLGSYTLPTQDEPLASDDESRSVWIEENEILYENIETGRITTIFSGVAPIRSVSFYPDRNDVVILSTGTDTYALETNIFGTQNFQPIYEGGVAPQHIVVDGTLYIADDNELYRVGL